jgi:Undecaprenyl-phosphate glucose phosphotransferase
MAAAPAVAELDFRLDEAGSGTGLLRHMARWQIVLAAKVFEVGTVALVALAVCAAHLNLHAAETARYLTGSLTIALACYVSFLNARLYDINLLIESARVMKPLSVCWTIVFTVVAAVLALVHEPDLYSRQWFVEFYAGGLVALGFERWSVERLVRSWIAHGHFTKAVAIVGANELAVELIARLRDNRNGIRVIGVFDDRRGDAGGRVSAIDRLGTVADLLEYGKTHTVDLVVVTLPLSATDRIEFVIRKLREQPFNIRILPGRIGFRMLSSIHLLRSELPGVQMVAVMDRPISEVALFVKSAFDRLAAMLLLVALSPVLLGCAVGIWLTDGRPVLFRQSRVGYKAREFTIYKFRTMRVDKGNDDGPAKRNDPRVYRFGGLLRKTSLDELPQLLNVLKGDMSLVGPRPHLSSARAAGKLYFEAATEYAARHRVKPGITGWAQVHGWRGPTETIEQIERRVEHDIYYIENWSLMLDFIILVKTIFNGFHGKNAF